MKTLSTLPIWVLSAALLVLADPAATHHQLLERASGFQSVDLSFQAGPVSYNLTIPADGQEYFTGKPFSIVVSAREQRENRKTQLV